MIVGLSWFVEIYNLKLGALPKPLTVRKSQEFFFVLSILGLSSWAGNSKFILHESSGRLKSVISYTIASGFDNDR